MSNRKGKYLSLLLRHDPGREGLTLDSAGWCKTSQLLKALAMSQSELDEIVATDNKKRFEYSHNKTRIRASQGHSIEVDLQYKPQVPPDILWHGTSWNTVGVIRATGILKMSRQSVHLSADQQTALDVAKRKKGNPTVLKILAKQMHSEGFQFYISTNGVWLVDHVPPKYIE